MTVEEASKLLWGRFENKKWIDKVIHTETEIHIIAKAVPTEYEIRETPIRTFGWPVVILERNSLEFDIVMEQSTETHQTEQPPTIV
jgi:hypothetical protein